MKHFFLALWAFVRNFFGLLSVALMCYLINDFFINSNEFVKKGETLEIMEKIISFCLIYLVIQINWSNNHSSFLWGLFDLCISIIPLVVLFNVNEVDTSGWTSGQINLFVLMKNTFILTISLDIFQNLLEFRKGGAKKPKK